MLLCTTAKWLLSLLCRKLGLIMRLIHEECIDDVLNQDKDLDSVNERTKFIIKVAVFLRRSSFEHLVM